MTLRAFVVEVELYSLRRIIEPPLKRALHRAVRKCYIHSKCAIKSRFHSHWLAINFTEITNFKAVVSGQAHAIDCFTTSAFANERHHVRYFGGQATLKCVPHLIFSGLVGVNKKYHANSNEGQKQYSHRSLLDSCLLYTSPSPRDGLLSRMPSS